MPHKSKKPRTTHQPLNLEIYIHKIGKQIDPECTISKDAKEALNKIAQCLTDEYVRSLAALLFHNGKKTVSTRDVLAATRILLKGGIAKHAVTEGTKAITKLSMEVPKKKGQKRMSTAQKTGLVLSPSRVASYVRQLINDYRVDTRMSANAPVYLAGVLDYLIAEILDIACNKVKNEKPHRVTAEVVHEVIREDDDLRTSLCFCL